jgi:hypothetical protein
MRDRGRDNAGALRNANQIGHRGDPEFLHNAPAMNFDRLLGRVQFRGDLFVQKAHDHETQDLKLARR